VVASPIAHHVLDRLEETQQIAGDVVQRVARVQSTAW